MRQEETAPAAVEALVELSERLDRAIRYCGELRDRSEYGSDEYRRINSKIEGLALAGSYLDEYLRSVGSGPERHPEDYCHRCQGPNISWYTPGTVWNPIMRTDPTGAWKWQEIICPPCFVELAGGGTWALIPMKDDGEQWTSADEREQLHRETSADAWDIGYMSAYLFERGEIHPEPVNPYRADAPTADGDQ